MKFSRNDGNPSINVSLDDYRQRDPVPELCAVCDTFTGPILDRLCESCAIQKQGDLAYFAGQRLRARYTAARRAAESDLDGSDPA